jgi:hypothetical protein
MTRLSPGVSVSDYPTAGSKPLPPSPFGFSCGLNFDPVPTVIMPVERKLKTQPASEAEKDHHQDENVFTFT